MSTPVPDEDDALVIGASAIATGIFNGRLTRRQIYVLAERGWPIFKMHGKLVARRGAMLAEIERREAAARERPYTGKSVA
jgi:hypothetical protein